MKMRLAAAVMAGAVMAGCGGGGSDSGPIAANPEEKSDWSTFQGNASHTGFVDVALDPARFAQIWTWSRPGGDNEPIGGINAVATASGKVFVTKDVYFGQAQLFALDQATGVQQWTYAFGPMASAGPAAVSGGVVYASTTDPAEKCVTWAIDAASGAYKFKMAYDCQWSSYFAPTIFAGSVLTASQNGTVNVFSTSDGAVRWSASAGNYDQTTPAGDARYVYQYGATQAGAAMRVFDRDAGTLVATIADPFSTGFSGYSNFSASVLGSLGNVLSFSGGGFSGRAASSSEQFDSRVLVDYDVARKAVAWRSANAYLAHPAVAGGVVYAARNAPATLDALSETDGRLLWSWAAPAGNASMHRNVVVTRNLAFVSTDTSVYAIDLATHAAVWRYPQPGMLAISAAKVLYIATGATLSDGTLVAIRLE